MKIIFLAKKLYFFDSFKKPKTIPKRHGKYFVYLLPTKIHNSFEILIASKTKSDDLLTIANCFNHYFSSIAKNN